MKAAALFRGTRHYQHLLNIQIELTKSCTQLFNDLNLKIKFSCLYYSTFFKELLGLSKIAQFNKIVVYFYRILIILSFSLSGI